MKFFKKTLIMIIILNIFFVLISFYNSYSYATNIDENASSFLSAGEKDNKLGEAVTAMSNEFSNLGKYLTMIGAGVLVASVTYMGIMYLISPPDKQAQLKTQLIGVVAGGIVVFGAYGIWKLAIHIFNT